MPKFKDAMGQPTEAGSRLALQCPVLKGQWRSTMSLKSTPMASSFIAEGFAYFNDSLAMGGSLDHERIDYTRAVVRQATSTGSMSAWWVLF